MIVVQRQDPGKAERVQQEMEGLFRALMPTRPAIANGRPTVWRPPLEVYETDEALVVRVEVAGLEGVDDEALSVTLDGETLVIRGERSDLRPAERRSFHEARIPYGAFGADVYIPFPVDVDRTEAEYHNGFLRIVLPRVAARTIVPQRPAVERGQGAP